MRISILIITAIVLTACSFDPDQKTHLFSEANPSFAEPITDDNNVDGWLISCLPPFQHCTDKAKEVCPSGFVGDQIGNGKAEVQAVFQRYLKLRYQTRQYQRAIGYCRDVFEANYGHQRPR